MKNITNTTHYAITDHNMYRVRLLICMLNTSSLPDVSPLTLCDVALGDVKPYQTSHN